MKALLHRNMRTFMLQFFVHPTTKLCTYEKDYYSAGNRARCCFLQ